MSSPYVIHKLGKKCYSVRRIAPNSGKIIHIFSKCTTKQKAQRQLNILESIRRRTFKQKR